MLIQLIKQEGALIISSLFAVVLLASRIIYLGGPCAEGLEMIYCPSMQFLFLVWNLILAWTPLLITFALGDQKRSSWVVGIAAVVWLLFFPNAPYLITDLIHLRPRAFIPLWYDAFLLFTYAYLGIWLAISALKKIKTQLTFHFNQTLSRIFVCLTLFLTGLGIYLGRIERWNSWDLFTRPGDLLKSVAQLLSNPTDNPQAYLMMGVFSVLMSLFYWLSFKENKWSN